MLARLDDPILAELVGELRNDDATLVRADHELREARMRFEVTSRKYAVMRDIVSRRLGFSPYAKSIALPDREDQVKFASRGRYRFIHMDVGDAAVAALDEAEEPVTLEELVATLRNGGIGYPADQLPRMLNAALMKKSGVAKTHDGRYLRQEEAELEDLPF